MEIRTADKMQTREAEAVPVTDEMIKEMGLDESLQEQIHGSPVEQPSEEKQTEQPQPQPVAPQPVVQQPVAQQSMVQQPVAHRPVQPPPSVPAVQPLSEFKPEPIDKYQSAEEWLAANLKKREAEIVANMQRAQIVTALAARYPGYHTYVLDVALKNIPNLPIGRVSAIDRDIGEFVRYCDEVAAEMRRQWMEQYRAQKQQELAQQPQGQTDQIAQQNPFQPARSPAGMQNPPFRVRSGGGTMPQKGEVDPFEMSKEEFFEKLARVKASQ